MDEDALPPTHEPYDPNDFEGQQDRFEDFDHWIPLND